MTDGSSVVLLLRVVFSLGLVLGMLLLFVRMLNKRTGGAAPRAGRVSVPVEVLGRTTVGRSATVQVVRVQDQVLLLGVTDQKVELIRELDPSLLPEPAEAAEAPRPTVAALVSGRRTPAFAGALVAGLAAQGRAGLSMGRGRHRG